MLPSNIAGLILLSDAILTYQNRFYIVLQVMIRSHNYLNLIFSLKLSACHGKSSSGIDT